MKNQYGENMNNKEELTQEQINNEVFELIKEKFLNEERLILRLKDFYIKINKFEEDCTNLDDEEEEIARKTKIIANKLLNNIIEEDELTLVSNKIIPFENKLKFVLEKDDNKISFNLVIDDDGFELELL